MLAQAGCLDRLPDPQQLADKPMDYLQREGDAAALVYRTGMLGSAPEKVSAGLSLADREPIMAWVAETMAPQLRLADPLPKQKTSVYKGLSGLSDGPIPVQSITDVVGPRLNVELLTDTTAATAYALDRLSTRLGVALPAADKLGDEETVVEIGPLTVGIRRPDAASIRADLDRTAHQTRKTQAAVEARVAQIENTLRAAAHPTITLVEIAHPDSYQNSRRADDPKFAIRHGLVRTGRLSQFVTPVAEPKRPPRMREGKEPSDPNRERFAAAVDDLFRQLGVRPQALPAPANDTLQRRPALLAIWMIRQNKSRIWGVKRQVPIAVLIDPTGQHVQIRAPQVDWQPLHTGLIEIGKRYVNVDLTCGPDDTVRFIKDTIDEAADAYPDTLLLTHAQNLRSMWKHLANGRIGLDTLAFGAGGPHSIRKFSGLRHVRVRTVDGGETPECYGVNDDGAGQPGGLWRFIVPRAFGSTTGKPSTASGALMGVSKVVPGEYDGKLTAPKPKAQVWNAQFIELFVAAVQDSDHPEHWAALAHELRHAAPYVRNATSMPWPLHIADQVEEYLLPARITDRAPEPPTETD